SDRVESWSCGRSSNFGDFTWLKYSNHNPQSPVLNEQKRFSPDRSAFAQRHDTRRVNRIRIEGASPSIRLRSRFPLHPSLSAMDGVSREFLQRFKIEEEDGRRNSPMFTGLRLLRPLLPPLKTAIDERDKAPGQKQNSIPFRERLALPMPPGV